MLDSISQNALVVGALSAWLGYSLVHFFGETRKLAHIPSVGFDGPILSYISAVQILLDPPGYLQKQWSRIPPGTKFVKVSPLRGGLSSQSYLRGIKKLLVRLTTLQSKYTMYSEEIDDNLQVIPIRDKLSKILGDLVPDVHDEVAKAFEDEFQLDGDGRNRGYVKACVDYAVNVFILAYFLPLFPAFFRPFVNWLISPIPRQYRQVKEYYQPFLDERKKAKEELGDQYEQPSTLLMWLADIADEYKRGDRDVVLRMLGVNFGSIHTTSITFTHAFFALLSRPQDYEEVRREVAHCVSEEGWTKAAMDKMRFLDSFMKESQRIDALSTVIGLRVAATDCTVSEVFIPKDTLIGAQMISAHFDNASWGDSAHEFDPYRFIKLEQEQGKRIQLPTSTVNNLTFGYGRHACPGRFFAAQEMKLLMAYFVHHYDLKLETKNGEKPKNFWFGMGNVPNATARVLMRRRLDASEF
ncbi:hypothetical protein NMY22_g1817 [Coprinellus aureogranulatus]|nr:hypothetical protein NMY22_g1817 [Coprinellus aureogranulatus]